MKQVGVVVNPVGEPDKARQLVELLEQFADVSVLETTEDDPGTAMAKQFADDGCDVVVAAGGDGTVRACAEGLIGTDVSLAVLPLGTGNLLAANLGLPDSLEEIAEVVDAGTDVRIDVGEANGEVFLIMAGFGLDTTIMDSTERESKDRLGPMAYVLTALSHLDDEPVDATIVIDDDQPIELSVATCLVGNMGKVLGALDVFPDAAWDDGSLDALAISAQGVIDWVAAASDTLSSEEETEHVSRWTADRVLIEFGNPQPYEMDGEPRPPVARLDIRTRPRALSVRRPRQ